MKSKDLHKSIRILEKQLSQAVDMKDVDELEQCLEIAYLEIMRRSKPKMFKFSKINNNENETIEN